MKSRLLVLMLCIPMWVCAQDGIANKRYFKKFFRGAKEKSLLVLGENHAAGAGAVLYPQLVTYLNRTTGLRTLLVEFGPAEAYFYNRYLETGDEKHLNYTLFAGGNEQWREAWRELYAYNTKLKDPLLIVGVDFDRTRTLAYALYSIFMGYDQRPDFVDELMAEIQTDEFYDTYTIGYPTAQDKRWVRNVKTLLKDRFWELHLFLNAEDLAVVVEMLRNEGVGYDDGREAILAKTTQRLITDSDEQLFFMLIGRSHAYINPLYGDRYSLVARLRDSTDIRMRTGAMLFQDSELGGGKARSKAVRLFEIERKEPWKLYFSELDKKRNRPFRIVPLVGNLAPLTHYADFILLVRGQRL